MTSSAGVVTTHTYFAPTIGLLQATSSYAGHRNFRTVKFSWPCTLGRSQPRLPALSLFYGLGGHQRSISCSVKITRITRMANALARFRLFLAGHKGGNLRRAFDLSTGVGYNFSRHFGVDLGIPYYFVGTPSSVKKNSPQAVSGDGLQTVISRVFRCFSVGNCAASGKSTDRKGYLLASVQSGGAALARDNGSP